MLIDFRELFPKYNITPKGVIQVGSHWAEEHDVLLEIGIKKFVYIEPCKDAFEVLKNKFDNNPDVILFNCACGEIETEMEMYVSPNNQGQSNSLLKPLLHLEQHPEVQFTETEMVKVIPLDKLPFDRSDYDLLVMDTQGAEGLVLRGAVETLATIDSIYTECNNGQTYEGNMELDQMEKFLNAYGFELKETFWPSNNWTWGDCFLTKVL